MSGCGSGSTARNCLWKGVLRAARVCADRDCVLLGDFNTGRHRLDETGATFRQTANLGRLSALGYVDAWRAVNPNKRDASWVSRAGNGFRIDHFFGPLTRHARIVAITLRGSSCRRSSLRPIYEALSAHRNRKTGTTTLQAWFFRNHEK